MKKNLPTVYLLLSLISLIILSSCAKGIKQHVTLDRAAGKWSINAIRYKIYYGTPVAKDSTVPWRPVVENYVSFDGVSHMDYCYNTSNSYSGQYAFVGSDSITLILGADNTRWKIDLLTSTNFNIEKTSTDDSAFPGATVVTYQGFVR